MSFMGISRRDTHDPMGTGCPQGLMMRMLMRQLVCEPLGLHSDYCIPLHDAVATVSPKQGLAMDLDAA